ncbi:ABC transporter permease [Granulicella sibirica]|uniref:Putative membrane protein n=1 Tax=Granulicella sibirica TaxID=2479048 RepID=A0A4V1L582_9BACT|nr:ABC transporter permease [Granulicella sibirica]RXH54854.1 putative membrane protein [Granulicella sibirica]
MHNAWLIAKREYLERVRTKAFLIATILIPLLMGGFVFGTAIFSKKTKSTSHIVIVTKDTQLALDLQDQLHKGKGSDMTIDTMAPGESVRDSLDQELDDHSIDGYMWITPASDNTGRPTFDYKPRSKADVATSSILSDALRTVLMRERLTHQGMVASDVDSMLAPVTIDTTNSSGKHKNANTSIAVAYVLFFLMYMVVMLYGMNTARSIIEEKTSRVFEVLLATIRPEEMLAGKILGVGAVGITQILIWMTAALILAATPFAASLANGDFAFSITWWQALFFVLYFIFGFLLYSSMAAALGAMTNSEQELQQLNMFLVIPLAFCMLMLPVVMNNSNGTWSRIVSLIPFCSPLLMNFRISLNPPPAWEVALSFLLMGITIWAVLWTASRIYRVGILMYGKKPNLPEILRWLKYS